MPASAVEPKLHTSGLIRLTRPQMFATMAGLMLAVLLAALDQTIVGTAEPRIIAQLSGFNRYPWVSTTYLLTSTLAVPIFAKLSDMYGRKWFFLGGATMFVFTSALCGASGTLTFLPIDGMNQLIVFRGLQGIGAGMMMGLAFTIIGDVFSPAERGKYQGFFAAAWGLASIFGPTLGGWLTDHVSWRAAFYVNMPVGLVAIAAIYFYFPELHPEGVQRRMDWAGLVSLILCIVPLLLALTWVTDYGWSSTRVESLLAFSVVMLAAFLRAESSAIEPLIPLSLFRNPIISLCSVAVFVLGMGMFGVIIYLPLFMQGVMGVSATQSGNLLTPLMMGAVVGSIVTGQLNLRLGSYKLAAVSGSILVATGMILFARMGNATAAHGRDSRHDHRRHRHGLAATGLHRRGPERCAAQTDGRGHGLYGVFSLHRQHHGSGDFRQRAADQLSSRPDGRHSARYSARGAEIVFQSAVCWRRCARNWTPPSADRKADATFCKCCWRTCESGC